MREKELRLALVCYGGVSLAVYMHGIVKEAWKLLRASRAVHANAPDAEIAALSDSERVYADLLAALRPHVSLRVLVDIVAGASAGGINGVQLTHAVAGGHDMEALREMWLGAADIDTLLDPDAAPKSIFAKLYARPLVWLAQRGRTDIDRIADPAARQEVGEKLSRFIRSRWFEPPFSGSRFTRLLYESLDAMERGSDARPLLPRDQPLDLFVTVTDFHGYPERLPLHSPPEIVETEHRLVIGFRDDGRGHRDLGGKAALTYAARATASFPGAFPPFRAGELDAVLAELGEGWPEREAFLARVFPRRADPQNATLIDGSVLNNAPFQPAIEALRNRPAHREVDRRFVYIDPKPGAHAVGLRSSDPGKPPGFFSTILRALADIPREQPIRDSLDHIATLSRRMRRLRYIVEGMRDEVDAAIERELGRTLSLFKLTPTRLTGWRSRVQSAAAREAGFSYAAYAHLKLSHVVEDVARLLALGEGGRGKLWRLIRTLGIDDVTAAVAKRGASSPYVAFLRRYDLQYRIRRLRFLIRRLTDIAGEADAHEQAALERAKARLYELLSPFLDRRTPAFYADRLKGLGNDPEAALGPLADALSLSALDAAADGTLVELLTAADIGKPVRRALVLAYLGFPFFDIATLPLLQGDGLDEFDEIKVDRISPDDAQTLVAGGAHATLKGLQFNAFGAFFSRAWRENDYLWGRLHAAERLIDIVASSLPDDATLPPGKLATLKTRAFRAILIAERPHLTRIDDLFARLDTIVGGDLSTGR